MSFKTICPNCDSELTAPDTVLGKRVKCKKCGDPFTAKRAAEPDDDDEDDRPTKVTTKARPKPTRDDDDDPPRKSAKARRPADDDDDDDEEDDEPKPKAKKKGKKKKKQGLPLALVFGIIGGVLLIGGAFVAYFGFIKEDKPTDPVVAKGDGPPLERGKARGGPGGSGGVNGQPAWVEHVDAANKYRIKFPTQPTTQDQQIPAGGAQQTVKATTARSGLETFVTNAIVLPAAEANLDPKIILDAAEQQAAAQIPGGATVTGRKDVTQGGVNGRELTLSLQGGAATGIVRLYITNGRIYTIGVVGPGLQASSPKGVTRLPLTLFQADLKQPAQTVRWRRTELPARARCGIVGSRSSDRSYAPPGGAVGRWLRPASRAFPPVPSDP